MSHYYALVCLPPGFPEAEIEKGVAAMMAPYSEDLEIEPVVDDGEVYWTNPRGFWDWWQIGGRWTGVLSGYDPASDPANIEVCDLCRGTGTRPDGLERFGAEWVAANNGCNGCRGKGTRTAWSTQWVKHSGDVQRWGDVRSRVLDADYLPYTVLAGERAVHKERYVPEAPTLDEKFVETGEVRPLLESLSDDAIVVVVDYHC